MKVIQTLKEKLKTKKDNEKISDLKLKKIQNKRKSQSKNHSKSSKKGDKIE